MQIGVVVVAYPRYEQRSRTQAERHFLPTRIGAMTYASGIEASSKLTRRPETRPDPETTAWRQCSTGGLGLDPRSTEELASPPTPMESMFNMKCTRSPSFFTSMNPHDAHTAAPTPAATPISADVSCLGVKGRETRKMQSRFKISTITSTSVSGSRSTMAASTEVMAGVVENIVKAVPTGMRDSAMLFRYRVPAAHRPRKNSWA